MAIDSTGTVYFTDSGPFGTLPLSLVVMRPRHLQQSPALRNLLADGYVVGRRDDTGIAQGFCLLHQVRARMLCGRRPAWRPLFPRLPATAYAAYRARTIYCPAAAVWQRPFLSAAA